MKSIVKRMVPLTVSDPMDITRMTLVHYIIHINIFEEDDTFNILVNARSGTDMFGTANIEEKGTPDYHILARISYIWKTSRR